MLMNIFFRTFLIFLLVIFSAKSEIINEIKIDGNQRVSNETIKMFSEIKINNDLSQNELSNVLKKLYSTNYFKNVSLNLSNNILYISVVENPIVQYLEFKGIKNKRILKVLNDQIEIKEKTPFVENKVRDEENRITNILRTNGFYFSKLETKIKKNNNNTVDLIFDIILGNRAYIKKITFIGDKKIKENKLKKIVLSEEHKFWKLLSKNKYLDINRIKIDENLLKNFYINRGYYNISVESSSAKVINNEDFELIFNINAGEKFYFGNLNLEIPKNYNSDSFSKIFDTMNNLKNKLYSYSEIKKLLNEIDKIALTKEFEFINAKFNETVAGNKINLTIKLEELEKYYIERVNIYGNYITDENVIRNSLLVDEGDAYNEILVNKSINEIKSKRLFEEVNKTIDNGSSSKFKVINISVKEQPTGELFAGAGTGTSGTTVSFGIKENNYLGRGVLLDTNVSLSQTAIQGGFSVSNPNFRNSNKSLNYGFEATEIDQMSKFGYKSTRTGFNIGTAFEQFEDIWFSPSIHNYYETLKTSSTASSAKQKQKGDYWDSSFIYGLSLNKLNQNFQPTSGFRAAFRQTIPIYADDFSLQNRFDYAKYYSPNDNAVLSLRFLAQSINSIAGDDVRISKRLFLPSKRLKGFVAGKVGPKDGQDYIGGNYATSLNFATTLPSLFKDLETIDFSLFIDAGNVWGVDYNDSIDDNSKIRSSSGLAVDWLTPVGPLSFSFAKPITKADTDATETFRFDIGTTF